MFNRHMYVYVAMVVSGAFALLGAAVFVVGIVSELLARDEPRAGISVSIQLALSGLCLAGVMALLVFGAALSSFRSYVDHKHRRERIRPVVRHAGYFQ